jgi:hypothetical protein
MIEDRTSSYRAHGGAAACSKVHTLTDDTRKGDSQKDPTQPSGQGRCSPGECDQPLRQQRAPLGYCNRFYFLGQSAVPYVHATTCTELKPGIERKFEPPT